MNFMKKVPWGIILGVSAVLVFWTIAGTIAAFYINSAVAGATTDGAGLFGTWYQVLLFVCDIVFGLVLIGSTAMYIYTHIEKAKAKEA